MRFGGRNADEETEMVATACGKCCYYSFCCCLCNARCCSHQHRRNQSEAHANGEQNQVDLAAARSAVSAIPRAVGEPSFMDQLVAVLVRQWLVLMRGAWKSAIFLLFLLIMSVSLVRYMDSLEDHGQPILLSAMLVPPISLLFPWLVITVVKDNGEGLVELMTVQGLKVTAHMTGVVIFSVITQFLWSMIVYVLSLIVATNVSTTPNKEEEELIEGEENERAKAKRTRMRAGMKENGKTFIMRGEKRLD